MFFAKNEIIELDDKKNYFVLDAAIIDNEIFYQIQEVNEQEAELIGPKTIVLAVNDDGSLYIEDATDEEKLAKLKERFANWISIYY